MLKITKNQRAALIKDSIVRLNIIRNVDDTIIQHGLMCRVDINQAPSTMTDRQLITHHGAIILATMYAGQSIHNQLRIRKLGDLYKT